MKNIINSIYLKLLLLILLSQTISVSANVLDNGLIQFGNGNQNSINHPLPGQSTFSKTSDMASLKLLLTDGQLERHTEIKYLNGATTGLDAGYDSGRYGGGTERFAINSHLVADSDGIDFGTQCLPPNNYENMVIPLAVYADEDKTIIFSAISTDLPNGINVFIEDKTLATFKLLDTNNSYEVVLNEKIAGIGRFYIHTSTVNLSEGEDNIAITITAPETITVDCGASLLPANTGVATTTENSTASDPISITYEDTELLTVCGGNFTRIWTATDASDNAISSTQIITVNPAALPSMTAPNAIGASGTCGSLPAPSKLPFTNGLSGGCLLSGSSFDSTFALVTDTNGETYKETWTAKDICGRVIASVSRSVTVLQNMGGLESLVFFSSKGAIVNTGISTIKGDIGTSVGAITGFGLPSELNGTISFANSVTTKANKDLQNLYIQLSNVPVTVMDHAPVFGNGETLKAGVYSTAAAGSLVGNITLDGQNNPNSLFLLKYNGAFSVAAASEVILINGQKASNVFWIAEGAISVGASSTLKGTLLAHTGAVSLGAGCDLEGRMYSTAGAVSINSVNAHLPSGNSSIPIIPINRSAYGEDLLGSVANFAIYSGAGAISNTGASGVIGDIGSNAGAITGFETSATSLINSVYNANAVTAKAKIDLNDAYQTLASMSGKPISPDLAGLTLTPGVYKVAAAGTLTGVITLDGQGDANAVFVIKFGGAFSTAAQSRVHLINGASYSNVFWVAEGAISMGALSFMKGTLIAHNAAVSLGARGNLEGRMLSNLGAISFNTGVAYIESLSCMDSSAAERSKSSDSKLADTPVELEATTLMAYPNPFMTYTTVRFTTPYTESDASLVLYDLRGAMIQVLYTGNTTANQKKEVKFNRQHLSPGVYFFRLTTSKEGKNVRVIIK